MILADYEQIEARARYGANDIRPGLTGWAQINGRDAVTVEEKARLDGWDGVTVDSFMELLNEYIVFYNERRKKQSLGWMSPRQYRASKGLVA